MPKEILHMNKVFIYLILSILFISLASAENIVYKQGEDAEIIQICADCTYVNITSISHANGTRLIGNVEMTKDGSYFNYTLDKSFTQSFGVYKVTGIGNPLGINEIWVYYFRVGEELNTGRAIGYLGFIIILLFSFFLTIYGANKIEWKHQKSNEGKILTINNFRYVKVLLFAISYFELMFLFGLSYKFFNEASINGFTQFFNFIYQLFLNLIYPLMIFLIIVMFVIWINNKKLNKKLKLGI